MCVPCPACPLIILYACCVVDLLLKAVTVTATVTMTATATTTVTVTATVTVTVTATVTVTVTANVDPVLPALSYCRLVVSWTCC